MAYLEKLLPEFRKGAKIRRKIWSDKVFMSSENIGESCFVILMLMIGNFGKNQKKI